MCPQFNSTKETQGTCKECRDNLGSTTAPTLGGGFQSFIRFNPLTLQTWLCADNVLRTVREVKQRRGPNATKTLLKMNLRPFIASIWPRSIRQVWAIFPGAEFYRTLSRFKKKKENSSSYVHVLHIRRFGVVVGQWTSKQCTKKRDARAELLVCS